MAKHQILFGPAIFGKVADIVSMMKDYRLVLAFIYIISIVISRETKLVVSCVVPERRLIMPTNFRSGTLITRAKPNQTVSDMTNKGRIGKARQRGLYLTYPLIPRDQLEYLLACHLRLFLNGRLSLGGVSLRGPVTSRSIISPSPRHAVRRWNMYVKVSVCLPHLCPLGIEANRDDLLQRYGP